MRNFYFINIWMSINLTCARSVELSDVMINFFNSLKTRTNTDFTRQNKARMIKEHAELLLDKFSLLECDEVVNYYLHSAYHHLPDMVECCPIDVDDASGCCIEHAHQPVKSALLSVTIY